MSQWGKLDRVNLPGTATVAQNFANVVFSQSQTANVAIGYALVVANVEYTIADIVSTTEVTLDVNYEAASSATQGGLAIQQQPKGLRTYGWGGQGAANLINGANTVNVRNVYGIDAIEANVASNKAKGISHTGWVHYQTWTNTQGTVRNRAEVLVAMSKNFNKSNVDFNIGADATDDAVISDNQIVITAQPAINGRTANAQFFGASYSVTATGTNGLVPTYSWQKSPNSIVWTDVIDTPYAGAVGFSGNTTANLAVSNVYLGINTVNVYIRALVSGNAAATVTSDAVQVLANGPQ